MKPNNRTGCTHVGLIAALLIIAVIFVLGWLTNANGLRKPLPPTPSPPVAENVEVSNHLKLLARSARLEMGHLNALSDKALQELQPHITRLSEALLWAEGAAITPPDLPDTERHTEDEKKHLGLCHRILAAELLRLSLLPEDEREGDEEYLQRLNAAYEWTEEQAGIDAVFGSENPSPPREDAPEPVLTPESP